MNREGGCACRAIRYAVTEKPLIVHACHCLDCQRVTGSVELAVLIDERGSVLEVRVVKGANGIGLNQAAIDNVKRRRYRPATKDGVPVKVNLPVIVKFELPR